MARATAGTAGSTDCAWRRRNASPSRATVGSTPGSGCLEAARRCSCSEKILAGEFTDGDTVEIGQELGTITTGAPAFAEQFDTAAKESASAPVAAGGDRGRTETEVPIEIAGSATPATVIEPALSPTITRKLNRVIPANLQIDARWDAIQKARQTVKNTARENAPSPSVMIAWAVVRAMEKHAPFRRLILEEDQIVQNDVFDLGIAVVTIFFGRLGGIHNSKRSFLEVPASLYTC